MRFESVYNHFLLKQYSLHYLVQSVRGGLGEDPQIMHIYEFVKRVLDSRPI